MSCSTTELKMEHSEAKNAASKARRLKKEASQVTTIDDLTRGIVNYKYLGLDFEKAGENNLRYEHMQATNSSVHPSLYEYSCLKDFLFFPFSPDSLLLTLIPRTRVANFGLSWMRRTI